MFLTCLFTILFPFVLWLLYWYYTVQYYENILKRIPGPKPLPLVGSALELADSKVILPKLMEYLEIYKGNFKVYLGSQPYLFICEAESLEFIFNSTTILKKSNIYSFMYNWIGLGLLTSWGDRWRKHRKLITPAFYFKILEEFIEIFNERSDILMTKLEVESKNGCFNIYPYISRCTLDITCETAMGTTVNAQDDLGSEYVKCIDTLLAMITIRTFSPIHANNILYPVTRTYWRERRALKVVHDYTKSIIRSRKIEYFANNDNQIERTDSYGRRKKQAFLDSLLEYSSKDPSFTQDDITQEVATFMLAGHETTAAAITFALYALATHPEIQRKAYDELRKIFTNDPKRHATHKDLREMRYLEMVIKETLRLYTVVPIVGRVIEEDIVMDGVLLPKGLMISIFLYGISNSSLFYENPQEFNPNRFNLENSKHRNPFIYVPFSAGSRNCIGQKFAMLEMKVVISNVLRNFELLPSMTDHKPVLKSEAALKSDNGVFVRLRNRYDK